MVAAATLVSVERASKHSRLYVRFGAVVTLATTAVLLVPAVASAQIDNPAPDASAPGAAVVTQVLGWLKWAGLAAALAGLLIGSVSVGVGHFGQHGGAAASGRKWILGGMGAAILSGLAWTITTTLYNATA